MIWNDITIIKPSEYKYYLVCATGAATGIAGDRIMAVIEWDDGFELFGYIITHWTDLPEFPNIS